MPHISSKKFKKETLDKLYGQFGHALEKSVRNSGTKFFLGDLLTNTEKIMLAKRFAAIYLLSQDVPVSYIAESLGLSYPTLSRMSLKYYVGKYSTLLKTLKKEEKEYIWNILEEILKAGLPPRCGRGRWKFLYK